MKQMIMLALENLENSKKELNSEKSHNAIIHAGMAKTLMTTANYPDLAQEIQRLTDTMQSGRIHDAHSLLEEIEAELKKLIGEERKEIVQHQPHLRLVKEIKCEHCRAAILNNSNFCGNCGQKVLRKQCPKCRNVSMGDCKFCGDCGENLQNVRAA